MLFLLHDEGITALKDDKYKIFLYVRLTCDACILTMSVRKHSIALQTVCNFHIFLVDFLFFKYQICNMTLGQCQHFHYFVL